MAFDCPASFLAPATLRIRRRRARCARVRRDAAALLREAKRPLIVAGGGVLYSQAGATLTAFAQAHGVPVAETQAGKGSLAWDHALNVGAIGVTGSPAANALAAEADLVFAVGTRLQDFTTGSHALFAADAKCLGLNVQALRCGQVRQCRAGGRCAIGAGRARRRAGRLAGATAPGPSRAKSLAASWNERVTALHDEPACGRAALRRRGDRRGARLGGRQRPIGHRRLRRRHPAGRAAQALAQPRMPAATTWSTATRAWATRSPAAWA